jgi:hypothetical protein
MIGTGGGTGLMWGESTTKCVSNLQRNKRQQNLFKYVLKISNTLFPYGVFGTININIFKEN